MNNKNVTMLVTFPGSITYGQLIKACKDSGITISGELAPHPNGQPYGTDLYKVQKGDPVPVKKLLGEAQRLLDLAFEHQRCGALNSAQLPLSMAWSMGTAAAWLRCELKGQFKGFRAGLPK